MSSSPYASSDFNRITTVRRWFLPACLLGLLLAGAGCRDAKTDSYQIPKEKDVEMNTAEAKAVPAAPAPMPAPAASAAASPQAGMAVPAGAVLIWTAPDGWQSKALGPMRKGSFTVPGPDGTAADLSITAFPGAVGGTLANINRWRGQVSLEPIGESDLPANTTRVTVDTLAFTVVDLVGTGDKPQRILGAMTPFDGAMWFFKLTGPDAFVASQKPAFLDFLKTVKASAPATP